jgi:hypothetical protein
MGAGRSNERPEQGAASWVTEGMATFYQYYGLLQIGELTPEEFWDFLLVKERRQTRFGQKPENDPYHRAALIFLAMDILIRQDSGGRYSLDDLVRYSNAAYQGKRLTASDMERIMSTLTGREYGDFFRC